MGANDTARGVELVELGDVDDVERGDEGSRDIDRLIRPSFAVTMAVRSKENGKIFTRMLR